MAIVTLTTDFGTKDYIAGAFKGRLLQQHPAIQVIDITHDIAPFNFNEAAYIFRNSTRHFPEHSYHLLMVNMFDQTNVEPILAYHEGQYYGVPDNGLLPMVLGTQPGQAVTLPLPAGGAFSFVAWADAFGRAVSELENGQAFHSLGAEPEMLQEKYTLAANYGPDYIDGRIIFIDRFENVVVNITRNDFETIGKGRPFIIAFKSRDTIEKISEGYPNAHEGTHLAFFNAAGFLEIAVNKGNAAGLFGLRAFNQQANAEFLKARLFYETIRVLFR